MKVVSPEGESELTEDQWEAASKLYFLSPCHTVCHGLTCCCRYLCSLCVCKTIVDGQASKQLGWILALAIDRIWRDRGYANVSGPAYSTKANHYNG